RGTLEGFGPFVRISQNESLLLLQAFMGTLTIMSLPLAAVVREHARAQAALARAAAIVTSSDDAIIGQTLDGLITTWDEGAARLAAGAAHELNNPLAAVIGQAQLLSEDSAARRGRRLEEIVEAGERIHAIVERMKHLTRIEIMEKAASLPEMLDIMRSSEPDTGGGLEAAVAGRQATSPYLVIVAHEQQSRYENLKDTFADESAGVILDRRMGERRRRHVPVEVERRRGDRRRHDVTADLQKHGWVIVLNGSTSSAPVT